MAVIIVVAGLISCEWCHLLSYLGLLRLLLTSGGGPRWSDLHSELQLYPQLSGYPGWCACDCRGTPRVSSSCRLVERVFEGVYVGSVHTAIWPVVTSSFSVSQQSADVAAGDARWSRSRILSDHRHNADGAAQDSAAGCWQDR